jgi:hypothetical protein
MAKVKLQSSILKIDFRIIRKVSKHSTPLRRSSHDLQCYFPLRRQQIGHIITTFPSSSLRDTKGTIAVAIATVSSGFRFLGPALLVATPRLPEDFKRWNREKVHEFRERLNRSS